MFVSFFTEKVANQLKLLHKQNIICTSNQGTIILNKNLHFELKCTKAKLERTQSMVSLGFFSSNSNINNEKNI